MGCRANTDVVPDETEPNADEPSDDLPSPSSFGFSPVRSSSGLPYPDQTPASRDDLPDRGLPGAPAAWGLRALARILDYMLFSLVFGYLAALLGTEVESDGDISGPTWPLLLFPIFFMIYETIGLAIFGQTIGKWVCQVKAVRYINGELAELSSTAVRAFIPGIFVLIAGRGPDVRHRGARLSPVRRRPDLPGVDRRHPLPGTPRQGSGHDRARGTPSAPDPGALTTPEQGRLLGS